MTLIIKGLSEIMRQKYGGDDKPEQAAINASVKWAEMMKKKLNLDGKTKKKIKLEELM